MSKFALALSAALLFFQTATTAQVAAPPAPAKARDLDNPQSFTHHFVELEGLRLHYVEEGKGPLVLLVHGIPYSWYSWRRQIPVLAAAGYRVVALDLRGFGETDAPSEVEAYNVLRVVGDLVGLVRSLGETEAVLIGHDLGSRVAYAASELRPDLFRALVMVNTPGAPRGAQPPSDGWKAIRAKTGKRFYHDYFQKPGEADPAMNADIARTLRSTFYSVAGSAAPQHRWHILVGPGETFMDTVFEPPALPAYLSRQALDVYVAAYSRHGFTPPLNYYRNLDANWALTPFLAGRKLTQPAAFIGGAVDPSNELSMPTYDALEQNLSNLRFKVMLDGIGHEAQEEAPDAVSALLLKFLKGMPLGQP